MKEWQATCFWFKSHKLKRICQFHITMEITPIRHHIMASGLLVLVPLLLQTNSDTLRHGLTRLVTDLGTRHQDVRSRSWKFWHGAYTDQRPLKGQKKQPPPVKIVSMKQGVWSATIGTCIKVTIKVHLRCSQQNVAESVILPLLACLLPSPVSCITTYQIQIL